MSQVNPSMELKLRKAGTIYVIDVIGEMDLYNAFRLKDLVKKMIDGVCVHRNAGDIDTLFISNVLNNTDMLVAIGKYFHAILKKNKIDRIIIASPLSAAIAAVIGLITDPGA